MHGKTSLNMQRIQLNGPIYRHWHNTSHQMSNFNMPHYYTSNQIAPLSNLIHRWRCSREFAIFYKIIFFFIGGSSIGCARSAGNLPAFHLTYTPFKNNETHLMRYWPKVPKYYLDKDQEPEDMQGKFFLNLHLEILTTQ